MIKMPFTLTQAKLISRDYQYLRGRIMDPQSFGKGYIECVAVSPYDEAKKWMFAQFYRDSKDPVRSLQFYKGDEYDVIVMAIPLLRKRGIFFQDLYAYTSAHQIPFDRFYYDRLQASGLLR